MLRKICFILLAILGGTAGASAQSLQIVGSDLLQVAVGEPLARYVKQSGLDAKVNFYGTIPALDALKNNKAQLAIVAAPIGQPPAPAGYLAIKFCFQVDYLLVNQQNPLNAMDLREIGGVFGSGRESLTRWGQLQLAGEWTSRPISPCTTSTDDGVVLELFKYTSLGRMPLSPTVRIMKTPDAMLQEIAGNPNAIGLCGYDPGPPAKVLLIAAEKPASAQAAALASAAAATAVRPTEQSVYSGEYTLRLPFYLVFKSTDKIRLRELIRLLLSEEYATHLREQHFMPVPETERSRSLLELDKSE